MQLCKAEGHARNSQLSISTGHLRIRIRFIPFESHDTDFWTKIPDTSSDVKEKWGGGAVCLLLGQTKHWFHSPHERSQMCLAHLCPLPLWKRPAPKQDLDNPPPPEQGSKISPQCCLFICHQTKLHTPFAAHGSDLMTTVKQQHPVVGV